MNSITMDYSLSQLKDLGKIQQKQIEENQKLLIKREEQLKALQQDQTRYQRFKRNLQRQELKYSSLRKLEDQIHRQRNFQSNFESDFETLKQIFLSKEQELKLISNKVDQLTKQLEQLKMIHLNTNDDQSENRSQLEKLKQELLIRNHLNEKQSEKILYQRQLLTRKRNELMELNRRIEEIQREIETNQKNSFVHSKSNSIQQIHSNNSNEHLNLVEIEKQMIQLAESLNPIQSSNKSNQENQKISTCTNLCPLKLNLEKSSDEKFDQKSFGKNLRLNDDILSFHYNSIKSTIRKRHSFSDSIDSTTNSILQSNSQLISIEVHDEISKNLSINQSTLSSESEFDLTNYENLFDAKLNNDDESSDEQIQDESTTMIDSLTSNTESEGSLTDDEQSIVSFSTISFNSLPNVKSSLKTNQSIKTHCRRVIFDPFTLLLDAAIVGDLQLLMESANKVSNISQPNDEGLTALHNAVCASNFDCVQFLVEFGSDINYADNDGWTPLHCAASCNNMKIIQYLVEHGAALFAITNKDQETPTEKCEENETNFEICSKYLRFAQEDLGLINNGLVFALYDYQSNESFSDELEFKQGDRLNIIRRGDQIETNWWWAKHQSSEQEGYVPRNYLGLYPRHRIENIQ